MQQKNFAQRLIGFLAVTILLAAITLNVVSLSLPYWLQFDVDRTGGLASTTGLDYYSRSRGAFLTCLSNTTAPPLTNPSYSDQVKYRSCLEIDLGGNLNSSMAGYLGTDADTIIVLRKLHIGLHIASGFVLCVALLICLFVLFTKPDQSGLVAPTGLSLLAAGLQFGALIAFNNTLLRELLPPVKGTTAASTAALSIYNAWPSNLQLATKVNPGPSYYIALGAFSTCLASAGICLVGLAMSKLRAPRSGTDEFDSPYAPTGSITKANAAAGNGEQQSYRMQRYPVDQPDAGSNWSVGGQSGGGQSGRLPRIPVNQSYGGY